VEAILDREAFFVSSGGLGKSFFALSLRSMLERQALFLSEVINPTILLDPDPLAGNDDPEVLVSRIKRLIRPNYKRRTFFSIDGFDCNPSPWPSSFNTLDHRASWRVLLSTRRNPGWVIGERSSNLFIDSDSFGKELGLDNTFLDVSFVSLKNTREFFDALYAIRELSKALDAKLNDKEEANRTRLSGLALLIVMVLLAILRFAGKPFGARSKGRLVLSLGCSANSSEYVQNKERTHTRLASLTYLPVRRINTPSLNSRFLLLTANQSGI
jgi:hypothetical protein